MSFTDEPTGGIFDRNRPYDGQPHTDMGERGQEMLYCRVDRSAEYEGSITMRDIHDAVLIGMLEACGINPEKLRDERGSRIHDYLDEQTLVDMDPVAAAQNASCEIEKRLGIYPNVPPAVMRHDISANWGRPDPEDDVEGGTYEG